MHRNKSNVMGSMQGGVNAGFSDDPEALGTHQAQHGQQSLLGELPWGYSLKDGVCQAAKGGGWEGLHRGVR